jgi:RND family efflux transporter MFP subunit
MPSCSREDQEIKEEVVRPVKMVTITTSTDALKRKFPGVVRAAKRADLSFQVPGTLKELPVEEGKQVKEGELVARLDQRDFENNLRNAQGQLARAQAALAGAQSEYERILRIQEQDAGAASESMVVRRRQILDQAKADIESVQAAVSAAEDRLGYASLKAPFSGVISKRYVDNFQEVLAKQTIFSLDDISSLEILVEVPEIIMASVRETAEVGKAVQTYAEFAAAPGKEFPLTLKEFSARADAKTQTYQIVLEMDRPKEGVSILPGMTATVVGKPPVQTTPEGFSVIPAVAVFADDKGDSNVWVVDQEDMTLSRRKVTTGNLTGQESIQINQGLETGEMIAISGVSRLREGMKVRPFDGTY